MAETKILAMCGKGGVGKTSVSALMAKILSSRKKARILAIDADPAVGLATALGITVKKTVNDIRNSLVEQMKKGSSPADRETLKMLDYEVFGALEERNGLALLAIGRPEDEGCFCRVNNLLKDIIADLAAKFDIVLIDGEAGIEQINRRVMKTVDTLVLVSDTSAKAIGVANTISHVAKDNRAVDFRRMGLIINRVRRPEEVDAIRLKTPIEILGALPDDDLIRDFDFHGNPLTEMPDNSPSISVVTSILKTLEII